MSNKVSRRPEYSLLIKRGVVLIVLDLLIFKVLQGAGGGIRIGQGQPPPAKQRVAGIDEG